MSINFVSQSSHVRCAPPAASTRVEALSAAARYARLAAFSAACALYVLVRYVILRSPQKQAKRSR
jgi:hypothetical protein